VTIANKTPDIIIKDGQSTIGSLYLGRRGLVSSLGGSYGLILLLGIR